MTLCPECGSAVAAPDESGAFRCPHCGTILPAAQLSCPSCGSPVPPEADACAQCGEPVSLFGQVMARHADSRRSPLWLEQARGQARGVRHEEELASRKRYEALLETDRRRLEVEAVAEQAQRRKDRLTLRWGFGIGIAIALAILAYALASLVR